MKKIFFVYNSSKEDVLSTVDNVITYIKNKDVMIYSDCDIVCSKYNLQMVTNEVLSSCDLAVILGGDGTILKFARDYGEYQIPVLGINIGRVGALASAKLSNYQELFDKYLNDDYYITKNLTLKCLVRNKEEQKEFVVYNDVVLHRGAYLQMLPIDVAINNSKFGHIYADGIIVATPTGSSAYNFSAGGPLLSHDSNCYVITPICSQTKDFSSLVVNKNEVVCLKVSDAKQEVFLSIDGGHLLPIKNGDVIEVYKADIDLCVVNFYRQYSIYETVYKVMSSNKKEND